MRWLKKDSGNNIFYTGQTDVKRDGKNISIQLRVDKKTSKAIVAVGKISTNKHVHKMNEKDKKLIDKLLVENSKEIIKSFFRSVNL